MSESINHTHDCGDEELKIEDLKLRYTTFLHVLLIKCFQNDIRYCKNNYFFCHTIVLES